MSEGTPGEDSVLRELREIFEDLEGLLKNADVATHLAARGVNISLAMVIADGLRAYLSGQRAEAAEELSIAVEEIRGRIALVAEASKNRPS